MAEIEGDPDATEDEADVDEADVDDSNVLEGVEVDEEKVGVTEEIVEVVGVAVIEVEAGEVKPPNVKSDPSGI